MKRGSILQLPIKKIYIITYDFYPFERMQVQIPCHAKVLLTHLLRKTQIQRGMNMVEDLYELEWMREQARDWAWKY